MLRSVTDVNRRSTIAADLLTSLFTNTSSTHHHADVDCTNNNSRVPIRSLSPFHYLPPTLSNIVHNRRYMRDLWGLKNPVVHRTHTRKIRCRMHVVDIVLILPFEIDLFVYISTFLDANQWFRSFMLGDRFGCLLFTGNPVYVGLYKNPVLRLGHTAKPEAVEQVVRHHFDTRRHSVFEINTWSPVGRLYPCMCRNIQAIVEAVGTDVRDRKSVV